ncbi:NADH-ubiquinone oxidoreductase-F iron-sulfur binding region domain-containing protein [Winogradskya consettensis]|uniref:NADH dehydrogenase n=1 Tax=Winogradskya consettensis TaxID=113560 RepID=A0A919VUL5_9ACTN|nr:NADH-ubiquinone oxidoreductase-F iron-sulfur binding region domain-containing protein [Actinoplanes consettensis]GIM75865.1 NADH dehydrogenase [Actinoplanes consettensis]
MTVVDVLPGVGRRLLAGSTDGRLDTHLARYARPPRLDGVQLVGLLRDAGLTGRGGAGFPTWRKVEAVLGASGVPVVVGNGSEGEPASGKDRALMAYQPHLVLDGLQIVAGAVGARQAYLYVAAASAVGVRAALGDRRGAGLDPVPVSVVVAPERFVAGEESAVVNAVAGRAAVPSDKRVRVTEAGVGGAPTLVQNVETLAHLALIARFGPHWFREAGTAEEPGTFLATVGGAVGVPGVVEAGYGVRLGDLVDAAGGPAERLQAVLVGGYHGGWVPALPELAVSRAGLAPYGASPGAGIVVALPVGVCGLVETARIAGYLAGEVAGQCGPCVNGLPRLATTLTDLAHRRGRAGLGREVDAVREVERLSLLVSGRGACRHPDGSVRMIRSAMRTFDADVAAHLAGRCVAEEAR